MKRHTLYFLLLAPALLAIDNDNDGMDDLWQQRHNIAPFTGSENPDNDARINLVESRNMSDPNQANSHMGIVIIRDISPQDGLPDVWQAQFGITAAQKFDDPDGDQRTNIEEGLLLSNPLVPDVPFTLLGNRPPEVERPGPDSFVARMADTAPGRRYRLEVSDTLLPDSWTTASLVGGGSPYQWGTGDEISAVAMTGAAPRQFFRWVIDDPDSDGDFLPDFLEMQAGTQVNNADSDADGIPDGNEFAGGTDANAANTFENSAEVEQEGPVPTLHLATKSKKVGNNWYKIDLQPPNDDIEHSGMGWETSPYGVEDSDSQEIFAPMYEAKLANLDYPGSSGAYVTWSSGGDAAGGAGTTWHRDDSYANTSSYSASATHQMCILRTSAQVAAPWKMTRHYLRALRTSPNPSTTNSVPTYSQIELVNLHVPKGQTLGPNTTALEPPVETSKSLTDSFYPVNVSSSSYPRSVDTVSAVNLSESPRPDPWVMLPKGDTRFLNVSYGPNSTHNIYQIDGAGFDPQTPVPRSASTLTLMSNSTGVATLRAGFSTDGNLETAVMIPQPLLRVAVYERKEMDVVVIPIAYQMVQGGATTNPQYTPSSATLQTYLDGVFLEQANIKMKVTILPPVPVAWDRGLGPEMYDSLNRGANDKILLPTSPINDTSDYKTAEEAAIFNAAPPSTDPHTLTIYYVWAENMLATGWDSPEAEASRHLSDISYKPCQGFAPGVPRLIGPTGLAHIAWVRDRPAILQDDVRRTIAHEIGHKLGLRHCADIDPQNVGRLRHGDNENRLMTGRVGAKRNQGPTRLIYQEWVKIRTSGILKLP